jgi:probable phosphoglycerate mutase
VKKIAIMVRHGESEANRKNIVTHELKGYPLTDLGRKQASTTGNILSSIAEKLDSIICSPLERTLETGQIIAIESGFKGELRIDHELRETDMGKYNNTKAENLPKYHYGLNGIESFINQSNRLKKAISGYDGINVFVTHMLPIKALACSYMGIEEEDSGGISIKNCSITIIDLEEEKILSLGALDMSEKLRKFLLE